MFIADRVSSNILVLVEDVELLMYGGNLISFENAFILLFRAPGWGDIRNI